MKPEQKHQTHEKKTDKAMGDLKDKKLDSGHAEKVQGGLRQRRGGGDDMPVES